MIKRRIVSRATAIVFGLLLALILIEALIRVAYPSLPMGLQIALRSVHVTPFSDQPLAPDPLWQSDGDYMTIVRPGAVNSPQAGSPTVTFHVTSYAWWGGRVGFRSPQPQDGRVEAVALGDSHTFCFTEMAQCWTSLLAQSTGLNLSNLGQPVTGSVSHARIYYDFVAKPELKLKQPSLVIWQFYGNDFNDDYGLALLNGTAKTPPQPQPTAAPLPQTPLAQWLRANSALYMLISTLARDRDHRDPGVEKFVDPYIIGTPQGLRLAFGQSYIRDAFNMAEPRNVEGETLSQAAILHTRDIVEKNGGKFVMILMPTKEEVYRFMISTIMDKAAIDAIAEPRLRMIEFCKVNNLVCLDLLPALEANASPSAQLYFPSDPHLSAKGNEVVAAAVAQFLKEQRIAQNP
jgi:hypothetical protein